MRRTDESTCGIADWKILNEARRRAEIHRAYGYLDSSPELGIGRDMKLNGIGALVVAIRDAYSAGWFGTRYTRHGWTWSPEVKSQDATC